MANSEMVYIEWTDPHSVDEWVELDHIEEEMEHIGKASKGEEISIMSCGFVIKEDEDAIALCLNYSPSDDHVSCVMLIPKAFITRRLTVYKMDDNTPSQ